MKLLYIISWYLLPIVLSFLRLSHSTNRYGTYHAISRRAIVTRNAISCPEIYKRFSTHHTYCKKSTCSVITQGVSEEDKEIILSLHNNFRSKLATGNETTCDHLPPAANMMELEWDEELAGIAQAHASLCVFNHDGDNERVVESFPVGQNLKKSVASGALTATSTKDWRGIESWYKSEVCFYTSDIIPSFYDGKYGHFSQVTWATTWKIGCGYAEYKEKGSKLSLYTCNYGPSGNTKGRPHYIAGKPCSQCPKNTECSTQYAGLCKSKTEDGPQIKRPPSTDYILFCDFSEDDPRECSEVGVKGSRNFSTRHIYSGNYKTVVLNRGEWIEIDLGWAQNKQGICPFLYTRFGPNNAKDPEKASLSLTFYLPGEQKFPAALPSIRDSLKKIFTTQGTHMKFDGKLKSVFTYKVNDDAAPHYIDIKIWGITRGPCKTSF